MKAFLVYGWSLKVDQRYERCACWYPYNAATEELNLILPCSIRCQKRATNEPSIARKQGEVPVRFGESRLMTMSASSSGGKEAGALRDEHVHLHPRSVTEGRDNWNS